jgi:glycosyltransferase involved in cell wall biosynthesis
MTILSVDILLSTALICVFLGAVLGKTSSPPAPSLHWYAPFFSGGGYSSEALSFVKIIAAYNISVLTTQHGDSFNPSYVDNMDKKDSELLKITDTFSASPGEIAICHSEPGAWHAPYPKYHTRRCPPSEASYTIGRTMFETDRIPSGWSDRLNRMDEIWVPTEFSANIFREYGVDAAKVVVVEEPVDTEFYRPLAPDTAPSFGSWMNKYYSPRQHAANTLLQQEEYVDDACVFLFVGKWEHRKGVQLLLKAFFGAFASGPQSEQTPKPNVLLAVVTSAYHSTSDFHSEISKYLREEGIVESGSADEGGNELAAALLERIVLLSDVPQRAMTELYNAANVLVSSAHHKHYCFFTAGAS